MRSDMGKVITERPRAGGHGIQYAKGEFRRLRRVPLDEQPKWEKIRRKWLNQSHSKGFTDVIGPLRGFILSQFGKPWNEIYSEIRRVLRPTGMSAIHATGHLLRFVALAKDIFLDEDGLPRYKICRGFGDGHIQELAYVDPLDGILKRNTWPRPRRKKRPMPTKEFIPVDERQVYKRLHGIWFLLTLTPFSEIEFDTRGVFDVVLKTCITPNSFRREVFQRMYGGYFFASAKRQVNKQEIRRQRLNAQCS